MSSTLGSADAAKAVGERRVLLIRAVGRLELRGGALARGLELDVHAAGPREPRGERPLAALKRRQRDGEPAEDDRVGVFTVIAQAHAEVGASERATELDLGGGGARLRQQSRQIRPLIEGATRLRQRRRRRQIQRAAHLDRLGRRQAQQAA